MRKAQTWSMDTIIAFVIFFAALGMFLIYLSTQNDGSQTIKNDAKTMPEILDSSSGSVPLIKNSQLDKDTLKKITTTDYKKLKNQLGIQSDFCIYITDNDGNLVNMNEILDNQGAGKLYGIGSKDLNLTATETCGQKYS